MILKGQKDEIQIVVNVDAESDKGRIIRDKLVIKVRTYKVSEKTKLLNEIDGVKGIDFIKEHLIEWGEFVDAEGKTIAFTEANVEDVCEVGPYYEALLEAVKEGVFGKRLNQKLKN